MNRYYWIRAEIARLGYYRQSGHCYPQLVEKKDNQVLADMRATIWANDYQAIQQKFVAVTGEQLAEGMTILCYARVNYHPVYGLSLQIADVDPSFTLGEMAMERVKTIQRLREEGVWDRNRSLQMPHLPQRLAVISVESSKGYQDFRNIIDHNSWDYAFFHMLFPALLQGDKAVESIGRQLDLVTRVCRHFDAVLIIRGGGGDVGLNCFDHYELAKRVACFPIPVITGIGHSTNETIVEMVSHTNSITPTDVAYLLIQYFHNFSVKLEEYRRNIAEWPAEVILQEKRHLDEATLRVAGSARLFTGRNHTQLQRLATLITMTPLQKVRGHMEQIGRVQEQLQKSLKMLMQRKRDRIEMHEQHVRLMDPDHVLSRGYSITRIGGKAIRDASCVNTGDRLDVTLHKGSLETIVKKRSI